MNCDKLQKLIHDQDGLDLDPATREHLATCTACEAVHKQVVDLRQLLSLKQYEQPDEAFADRMVYKVRTRLENATGDEEKETWWSGILSQENVSWRFGLVTVLLLLLSVQLFIRPAQVGDELPFAATEPAALAEPVMLLASTNLAADGIDNNSVPIMQIVSNTQPGAQTKPRNVRFVGN